MIILFDHSPLNSLAAHCCVPGTLVPTVCNSSGCFLVPMLLFFPLQIKDILKPEVMEEIVLETRRRLLDLEG